VGIKAPGQVELPEAAGPQATATVAKDPSVAAAGVEKSQATTALAASPMSRYPGLPGFPNPSHPGAGLGTATGSNTPQAGGPVRQVLCIDHVHLPRDGNVLQRKLELVVVFYLASLVIIVGI